MKKRNWVQIVDIGAKQYTCGHIGCGMKVAPDRGYHANQFHYEIDPNIMVHAKIYICPSCEKPTYFENYSTGIIRTKLPTQIQIPGIAIGSDIKHLPQEISLLYNEIRTATSNSAYSLVILGCRKLLMHIAVKEGAKEGLNFVSYVDYLVSNNFAPPNSKSWIDKIRSKGNEANHEIVIMSKEDVEVIMTFIQMLLQFIYSFPAEAQN